MQQSSVNGKAIIMYTLVGVVILALVVGGVSWAKSRSQQYASKSSQGQVAQNQNQAPGSSNNSSTQEQNPNNAANGSAPTNSQPSTGVAANTGPSTVPATGASDWLVFVLALSAASYAGARFVQSRRRLLSLR